MLEIIITIALIGTIIPAVYLTTYSLANINKRSRNIAVVNMAAENKIESLRSIGYNAINSGQIDFTNELPAELPKPNSAIQNVTISNGKKYVELTISYQDVNKQRTTKYKTIVSETGVGQ